jgi:uncharacterized protein YndB with AHSA1/START domain
MNTKNMAQAKAKVVLERTYRARIEDVWDLWVTKEGFESWWGPQGFRADVQVIEPHVGGVLRYDMIAHSPEMIATMKQMGQPISHATRSRFTEVKRHERLVLTNVIDFIAGVEPYESDIAVDFSVVGELVRMVITLDPMHSEEFDQMQKEGLTSQLSKLDARFT